MATVGKSVQFRGIKNAINAYENNGVASWGLFQGTQFLTKYQGDNIEEGKALLKTFLDALDQRSADTNTYTLCVYDEPDGKITSATKYDGSFNFRLVDNLDEHNAGKFENRLAGIEDKLNSVLEPDDTEPEPGPQQRIWDALGKILEHPHVQQIIATKVMGLIEGVSNTVGNIFKPGQVANARGAAIGSAPQDENQKLQQAVNILSNVDPQLGTHLLKLAEVAAADPAKYQQLIGMLNLL